MNTALNKQRISVTFSTMLPTKAKFYLALASLRLEACFALLFHENLVESMPWWRRLAL